MLVYAESRGAFLTGRVVIGSYPVKEAVPPPSVVRVQHYCHQQEFCGVGRRVGWFRVLLRRMDWLLLNLFNECLYDL